MTKYIVAAMVALSMSASANECGKWIDLVGIGVGSDDVDGLRMITVRLKDIAYVVAPAGEYWGSVNFYSNIDFKVYFVPSDQWKRLHTCLDAVGPP